MLKAADVEAEVKAIELVQWQVTDITNDEGGPYRGTDFSRRGCHIGVTVITADWGALARTYDMTNRSRVAEATRDRIVDATESLLATRPIGAITLETIADASGVSVQTILRHLQSRDGCFDAVGHRVQERIRSQRERSEPGDALGAIQDLVQHYEDEGLLILNLLSQEATEGLAARAVAEGRRYHRQWVQQALLPQRARLRSADLDALVAATDIYIWKVLRLDLRRSKARVQRTIHRLVQCILEDL